MDESINLENYPGTKQWLLQFKAALDKRNEGKKDTISWSQLHRPRVKSELDIKEKILIQNTRNESLPVRICAALDDQSVYGSQGINFVIPRNKANLRFLLAVLNSKLINYLFATKFLNLAIKAEYVKQVKLPKATKEEQQKLADLAEAMIEAKKSFALAQHDEKKCSRADCMPTKPMSEADKKLLEQRIALIDSQINAAVYKLYGLTETEIKVVEGK